MFLSDRTGTYDAFVIQIENGKSIGSPEKCLMIIPTSGGKPQKLWQSENDLRDLRVHPDGRRIAFYTTRSTTEVWVMENFLK